MIDKYLINREVVYIWEFPINHLNKNNIIPKMTEVLAEFSKWFINETNLFEKSLTLPIVVGILYKAGRFVHNKIRTYKTGRNLFPYYTKKIIEEAQKKYIRTKCQNIDPANEISLKQSFAFATKEDLLRFFLRKVFRVNENENRFYLILADSGMGKTTFLINLFIRYKSFFYFNIHKKVSQLPPPEVVA